MRKTEKISRNNNNNKNNNVTKQNQKEKKSEGCQGWDGVMEVFRKKLLLPPIRLLGAVNSNLIPGKGI